METTEPAFVAGTLAWCNERRDEQGMEALDRLPKGKVMDPLSCPCGAATGLFVGRGYWGEDEESCLEKKRPVPKDVLEFTNAFDDYLLPQYVEPD